MVLSHGVVLIQLLSSTSLTKLTSFFKQRTAISTMGKFIIPTLGTRPRSTCTAHHISLTTAESSATVIALPLATTWIGHDIGEIAALILVGIIETIKTSS